jgi:hypothetical protein
MDLPWPLNDLATGFVTLSPRAMLDAPGQLDTLLQQCAGLAQVAHLAASQCQYIDPEEGAGLTETLHVLAGSTQLARDLSRHVQRQKKEGNI